MHTEVNGLLGTGKRARWRRRGGAEESGGRLIARVLAARGMRGREEIDRFLSPTLAHLHEPALLHGVERAAARLLEAAKACERIFIYGDYDADGITATAILFHMLRALVPDADVRTFVPHRDEGYGLSAGAIRELSHEGARVIVSVDCGITAIEPALEARRLGVDLVITDHHEMRADGRVPEAYAIVHPRVTERGEPAYPFTALCGAGVAFKLAWRLATLHAGPERVGSDLRELLLELLGLAALGTIADVVPLVGENRIIARHGLRRARDTRIEGLRRLIDASGLADERIEAEDVAFRLAPRLNAAGRIGHAREAVRLLTTARGAEAEAIAKDLSERNDQRRRIERRIAEDAARLAEEAGMTGPGRRAIVLAQEGWERGVVGIVCSRLVERFSRPAILLRREGDLCSGSGRAGGGFNLHEALGACGEHLRTYGGHEAAAGLTVEASRFEGFVEAFVARANESLSPEDLVPMIEIDAGAEVRELDAETVGAIERLGPFGQGNPEPAVVIRGAVVQAWAETFGRDGSHAKLTLRSADGRGAVRVLGWRWAEELVEVPPGVAVDAVVRPKLNRWNGRSVVEPELLDLRVV